MGDAWFSIMSILNAHNDCSTDPRRTGVMESNSFLHINGGNQYVELRKKKGETLELMKPLYYVSVQLEVKSSGKIALHQGENQVYECFVCYANYFDLRICNLH